MSNSYDMIDRFLRNNLDDTEYQEYSKALEEVSSVVRGKPTAMMVGIHRGTEPGNVLRWAGKDGEAYYKSKAAGHDVIPLFTSAPSIPEGWQLVPITPTKEMIENAHLAEHCGNTDRHFVRAYEAMLEAAPKPES